MADKKWIQKTHMKKGLFTKKAKAAGMSVGAYASKVTKPGSHASATTKKEGSLAKTLKKLSHKGRKTHYTKY